MTCIRATLLPIFPREKSRRVEVPFEPERIAYAVNDHLVRANIRYGERYYMPDILHAGVVYGRDPDEVWLPIPWAIAFGVLDCEDAAAWVAARDHVVRGVDSQVAIYRVKNSLMHAVVARPVRAPLDALDAWTLEETHTHRLIDPSRAIG